MTISKRFTLIGMYQTMRSLESKVLKTGFFVSDQINIVLLKSNWQVYSPSLQIITPPATCPTWSFF